MNNNVINNYLAIQDYIKNNTQDRSSRNIISVTKTFPEDKFMPLIKHGCIHFGENKVQEAQLKWPEVLEKFKNVKLFGTCYTKKL